MNFFKRIGKDKSYVVLNTFYAYFAQGVAVIMLGSILPALKESYQLSYQVGGMLLSMTAVGYAIVGLSAGYLPAYIGLKNSFISLTAPLGLGFVVLLLTRNPVLLLLSMFFVGINKGAVTNYNNLIVSRYSGGDAGPLNMLHASFAVGACIAPIMVLTCSRVDASGWRVAVTISAVISFIGIALMLPMKLENTRQEKSEGKKSFSYGFFREKIFWISALICFLYQCIENAMMGWLTTFFIDSGVMSDDAAQIVTAILWMSLLVGRMACSLLAAKMKSRTMLVIMSFGQLLFLALLLVSHSLPMMFVATVGIGLSMSGMYGTTVSNAGDLFDRYPVCMGFYVLLGSMGAVVAPSLIGTIADRSSIHAGFTAMLAAAVVLIVLTLKNSADRKKSEVSYGRK